MNMYQETLVIASREKNNYGVKSVSNWIGSIGTVE